MLVRFDDDDTGVVGDRRRTQAETLAGIDYGNHVATQVDDAQHIARSTRYRGDLGVTQDFLHLHHVDAVGLVVQAKGHPLQNRIFGTLCRTFLHVPSLIKNRSVRYARVDPLVINYRARWHRLTNSQCSLPPFRRFAPPLAISSASAATSSSAHMCSITVPANQGRWVR